MGPTQSWAPAEGTVANRESSTAEKGGSDIVYRGDTEGVEYMIEPTSKPSTAEKPDGGGGEDLGRWRSSFGRLPSEEVAMQEEQGPSLSEEREAVL